MWNGAPATLKANPASMSVAPRSTIGAMAPPARVATTAWRVFGVAKEDLNRPARGNMTDEREQIGSQIAGSPVTHCLERTIQAGTSDDDLALVELANAGRDHMDIDLAWLMLVLGRPDDFRVLVGGQRGGIVRQALPAPARPRLGVFDPQA